MASDSSATLILLRHGQSTWNEANLFTGWYDADLTPKGEQEAVTGGELLLNLFEANHIEYIFCSPGAEWVPQCIASRATARASCTARLMSSTGVPVSSMTMSTGSSSRATP